MRPREVRLFADMGDIDGHVVRAQRARIAAGSVTVECVHGPMATERLEGHLLLRQWTALDDRGNVHRATLRGGTESRDRATLEITFPGVDPEARWLDVAVKGHDGRPVLQVRVPLTDDGDAPVPAIPATPPPRGPNQARPTSPDN